MSWRLIQVRLAASRTGMQPFFLLSYPARRFPISLYGHQSRKTGHYCCVCCSSLTPALSFFARCNLAPENSVMRCKVAHLSCTHSAAHSPMLMAACVCIEKCPSSRFRKVKYYFLWQGLNSHSDFFLRCAALLADLVFRIASL